MSSKRFRTSGSIVMSLIFAAISSIQPGYIQGEEHQKTTRKPLLGMNNTKFEKIVGGKITSIRYFPFMVSIQLFHDKWEHSCGGSVLTSRVILTACHCLYVERYPIRLRQPTYARIVAGETDLAVRGRYAQQRFAKKFAVHPNCGDSSSGTDLYRDVGVIVMKSPLRFNPHIQPVKVFSKDKRIALAELKRLQTIGAHCFSPGWGVVKYPDQKSRYLKYAKKYLLTSSVCEEQLCEYGETFCIDYDRFDQVCAVGHESSICSGDSGGPLICNGHIFGIVSYGAVCSFNVPQVYSNIIPILDLVKHYTNS